MSEWASEWTNRRTNERTNKQRIKRETNERLDEYKFYRILFRYGWYVQNARETAELELFLAFLLRFHLHNITAPNREETINREKTLLSPAV